VVPRGRSQPQAHGESLGRRVAGRRRALAALAALGLAAGCGGGEPHVVLISIDTLRPDHMGVYGYARDTTPEIDRFFGSGTVFATASASAPCTVPSVRQMLAGGFDQREDRVPLAELLAQRGYATAAIVSQNHFVHETARDYARGFAHFDMQAPDEVDHHGLSTRTADAVSDRALAWLRERPAGAPFLLWLHYFDPHDPYEPPAEHRIFHAGDASARSGDRRAALMAERRSEAEPWNQAGYVFSEVDVAHLHDLYDGEIHFADAQVGRVLTALEAAGLVEDSLVILTSDHGEWLGEGDRWDHCITLEDPEILVPLLVRDRGGRLGGAARVATPVSTLDLLPTVLGVLGAPPPGALYHGVDLRALPEDRIAMALWSRLATARTRHWQILDVDGRRSLRARGEARADPAALRRLNEALAAAAPIRERTAGQWRSTLLELRALGYVE